MMNEQTHSVRRVGTITTGVAMILTGLVLLADLFGLIDSHTLLLLFRFAPLMLVGVGVELCVFGAKGDRVILKYDFLSLIFCILLTCAGFCLSALPLLADSGALNF